MTDDPEMKTPIHNKYAQQYADDLAANREQQGGITAQIADLQKRLEQLRLEESWLSQAQGSLPGAPTSSEPGAAAVAAEAPPADKAGQPETSAPVEAVVKEPRTVPSPRPDGPAKARPPKQPARKSTAKKTATAKKATAKKTAQKPAPEQAPQPEAAATKAAAKKTAAEEKSGPPLWQLALDVLLKTPGQPVVAREVHDRIAQDHPSRRATAQTVRNGLETLVRKKLAEKSRQQGSVMYTAYADGGGVTAADGPAGS